MVAEAHLRGDATSFSWAYHDEGLHWGFSGKHFLDAISERPGLIMFTKCCADLQPMLRDAASGTEEDQAAAMMQVGVG